MPLSTQQLSGYLAQEDLCAMQCIHHGLINRVACTIANCNWSVVTYPLRPIEALKRIDTQHHREAYSQNGGYRNLILKLSFSLFIYKTVSLLLIYLLLKLLCHFPYFHFLLFLWICSSTCLLDNDTWFALGSQVER